MGSSATEVERLLQAAKLHLARGELQEAVGRASEAIRLNPKEPPAYLIRAEALRRLKHPDRALADLAVAIRLDPQQPSSYVVRAEILKRRNHFDQAIADATFALTLEPRNAAAFSIRAECRSAIGDREGAAEDVQEMLLIDPTRPVPTLNAQTTSTSSDVEMGNERFWKQAGRPDPKQQANIFADGKPVDKTYRSRPVVSDEDAPEALGVASGYKPETIAKPIPRIRGRSNRSISNGGAALLGIGVVLVAGCALWIVFRGAPEPATSPKQADPQFSKVARSHDGEEATGSTSAPSGERPQPIENTVAERDRPSPALTPSDPTTEGLEGNQVVRDLGSFALNKSGRNWIVVIPEHFTKAEVAFYRGDPSDLTLNAAWEGHFQINGKDVVRFKKGYKDGDMPVFVFHDFTSDTDYTEKNDYKKGELRHYLVITRYLHPGENSFYYYHEQRPDLTMGVILRIAGASQEPVAELGGAFPTETASTAELRTSGINQPGFTIAKSPRSPGSRSPELVELTELKPPDPATYPSLTRDGLRIFYEGKNSEIWTAKRKDSDSISQSKERLFDGRHPAISSDALELIFLAPRSDGKQGLSLHVTTRNTTEQPFRRPTEIRELRDQKDPKSPWLSADGLTLLFTRGRGDGSGAEIVACSRSILRSAWSKPKPLALSPSVVDGVCPTWATMSEDGLSLYCCIEGGGRMRDQRPNLTIWSRKAKDRPFSNPTFIEIAGLPPLVGRCPRYVPATNELYLSWGKISVVRNFKPTPNSRSVATASREAAPEISNLTEINTRGKDFCPWLSPDGLMIYWVMEPPGAEGEVWTAHRKDPGSLFTDKRQIGYGRHVAVSSNGLTMFLIARRADGKPGDSIQMGTRRSIDDSFGRSQEVPELRSIPRPRNLFLSEDRLTLLFNEGDDATFRLSLTTRRSLQSPWETPRALPISSRVKFDGLVLCPYLTRDALTLLCTVQNSAGPRFVIMSRRTTNQPFANPVFAALRDVKEFNGWIPRYVEGTKELFFCSQRLSPGGEMNIWVVRNFMIPKPK